MATTTTKTMATVITTERDDETDAGNTVTMHFRQTQAYASPATEILYGGAAGGGKSFLLRMAAINWCSEIPGLICFLFRRHYPDLWSNHMEGPSSFPMLLGPMMGNGECSIAGTTIRFTNGSKIFLRHCQHENDLTKYQGAEIHLLLIDELTHFTESIYRFLRSRVRLGGFNITGRTASVFPRIICASNPGSTGHHWVKKMFVDAGPETCWRAPAEEGGMLRQFLPATVDDNPTLLEHDPLYLKRLEGLGDPALVKAMREGDWNVVAGSMFGDKFSYKRHVIKPFPVPGNWEVWRGGDDGYAAPAAIYWLTQNPDTGTFYVIDEIYQNGLLPDRLAYKILKKDRSVKVDWGFGVVENNDEQLSGELDSAAFSNIGTGRPSRGEQMNEKGCLWAPISKVGLGDRSFREMRVHMMHQALSPNPLEEMMDDGKTKPALQIFERCVNLIRTLPTLPISDLNPEDVDPDSEAHAFDAVTYGMVRKKRFFLEEKVYGL